MPDLGWSNYMEQQEKTEFLNALSVQKTQDEFGKDRYFVTDGTTGDWIGDAFDNSDAAFEEIDAIRKDADGSSLSVYRRTGSLSPVTDKLLSEPAGKAKPKS